MELRSTDVRSPSTRPDPKRSDRVSAAAVVVDAETVVAAVDETVGSSSFLTLRKWGVGSVRAPSLKISKETFWSENSLIKDPPM